MKYLLFRNSDFYICILCVLHFTWASFIFSRLHSTKLLFYDTDGKKNLPRINLATFIHT